MNCQLCGHEFNPSGIACHAECPLGSHCNLICCPKCGYQMVDDSKSRFANFLRRFWPSSDKEDEKKENNGSRQKPATRRKHGQEGEHLVPLSHIPEGKTVEVGDTQDMSPSRLAKLSIFGLIPGGEVEVLQRRPAPILRIDQTELTLNEDILNQIWVRV